MGSVISGLFGLGSSIIQSNATEDAANQQAQASEQATQAAAAATQGQQQLDQEGLDLSQYLQGIYQQDYAGLNPELGGIYNSELNSTGSQIPQADSSALAALMSPGTADAGAGTNALGMNQAVQSYLSNPGGTLSGINGVGGQSLGFYENEAQNGLNPQYAQNALSQSAAGDQSSINNIVNQLGPDANPNALIQNAQNQYLSQRTNLAGQFAGDSQQLANQAQGAAQSTAAGIDSQTMQMLQAAAQSGNSQAQQYLTNLTGAANLGSSLTSGVQGAVEGQQSYIPGVAQQLLNTGSQYGQAASQAAGMAQQDSTNASNIQANGAANNPFTGLASFFASNPNLFSSQQTQPSQVGQGLGSVDLSQFSTGDY
jgi:hypothetical protein